MKQQYKRGYILSVAILSFLILDINAQNKDSLSIKGFKELSNLFHKHKKDSLLSLSIAKIYLQKAKSKKDTIKMAKGFHYLSIVNKSNDSLFLGYNDSIIESTKLVKTEFFPVTAYFNKGDYFYKNRLFYKSLENYLLAVKSTSNEKYSNIIKHRLGLLKSRYNKNKEYLMLLKEVYSYNKRNNYEKEYVDYHLSILFALSDAYLRNKKNDSARYFCSIGYAKSIENNRKLFKNYFRLEKGVIEFWDKNYKTAIDSINLAIPEIIKAKDLANLSYANFYLGKSFDKLNNEKKALSYFEKVDSIYFLSKDIHPDLREGYEFVIKYYREKDNPEKELVYVRKLLDLDQYFSKNYKSITNYFNKEYDTPKLLFKQKEIVKSLKKENTLQGWLLLFSIILVFSAIFFGVYNFKKRKVYKKRFQEILKETKKDKLRTTKKDKREKEKELALPQKKIDEILQKLKSFEEGKRYLEQDITLNSLAKSLETNTSYLSKVINYYKKLSFSNYLNTLRIEYIIEELKENKTYRKYTVKALAHEVGFKNAESFSKAFYNLKGIKPSYFIKELNKG
ncbi:helix-turn-helix domain-containing protein [Tenacibaculum sp. SSH1-16]|uniref:helix-turn-helix domain-containing protein n=1 Tax=Tenacibaculum sp. SSH1-16 TaxID=3136667 RepID=UPI0032C3FC4C